jgi:hypothetical protein
MVGEEMQGLILRCDGDAYPRVVTTFLRGQTLAGCTAAVRKDSSFVYGICRLVSDAERALSPVTAASGTCPDALPTCWF